MKWTLGIRDIQKASNIPNYFLRQKYMVYFNYLDRGKRARLKRIKYFPVTRIK